MTGSAANSEFRKKIILVVGAGRGIGKRIALGFARYGARIALVGRSKAEIDLAHIEIEQAGGNALRIRADVTDPEQMTLAVDRARVTFGAPIDVLVCAAGIAGPFDKQVALTSGGETGIRTLGTLSRTHAFQACALSRSAIPPRMSIRTGGP